MDNSFSKVGFKFGHFTVIEKTDKKTKRGYIYKCQCDCGNIVEIVSSNMRKGYKMDCGCQKENKVGNNKKYNRIEIEGDRAKIYFFNCDRYAIIDAEDVEKVKNLCFYDRETNYPCAYYKGKKLRLHNVILPNEKEGFVVDHINRNRLDNRKCNLRIASHAENMRNSKLFKTNTTGHKHISYSKKIKKYIVAFEYDKVHHWVGQFKDLETAVQKLEEYKKEHNL